MPIYEYRCQDCGHELEVLQKISDPKLTTCPACGQETLAKLVSASAFILKGTGWYVTDFRDKDKPKAAKGNGKDGGEAGKSGDAADSGKKSTADSDKKGTAAKATDSKPQKKAAGD